MTDYQFQTYQMTAMQMPFTLKFALIGDGPIPAELTQVAKKVEQFLQQVDQNFSPFKADSLVSKYQRGELTAAEFSPQFQEVYGIAIQAQQVTNGAFDPFYAEQYNPTGLVKGWAIQRAFERFVQPLINRQIVLGAALNGAGDIQMAVVDNTDFRWEIAIENPADVQQVIWHYQIGTGAIATSGFSQHAGHIKVQTVPDLNQVTIVASTLIEADVLATAAITMGSSQLQKFRKTYPLTGLLVDQQQQIQEIGVGEGS